MIKKYNNAFLIFIFLLSVTKIYSYSVDTRIAIGPSWRSFLSLEQYDVRGFSELPIVEKNISSLDSMFYAQVKIDATTDTRYKFQCLLGGGSLNNGKTAIRQAYSTGQSEVLVPLRKEALIHSSLLITDVSIGRKFISCSECPFSVTPLLGYNFDREHTHAVFQTTTDQEQTVNTTWKGFTIGIQGLFEQQGWLLSGLYKVVIGHVNSVLTSSLITNSSITQLTLFPAKEQRYASMIGNIISAELCYQENECIRYGVQGMIFYFKSNKFGKVDIIQQAPTATSTLFVERARLDNIIWHQVMLLFFAEYRF